MVKDKPRAKPNPRPQTTYFWERRPLNGQPIHPDLDPDPQLGNLWTRPRGRHTSGRYIPGRPTNIENVRRSRRNFDIHPDQLRGEYLNALTGWPPEPPEGWYGPDVPMWAYQHGIIAPRPDGNQSTGWLNAPVNTLLVRAQQQQQVINRRAVEARELRRNEQVIGYPPIPNDPFPDMQAIREVIDLVSDDDSDSSVQEVHRPRSRNRRPIKRARYHTNSPEY